MNQPSIVVRSGLPALLAAVALCACQGPPPTGQRQADSQTWAACRARAAQAYEQRNRADIYSPGSQVNTPHSASYDIDTPSRGLSDLFVHDRMVNDCVRNTGSQSDRAPPAPPQQ